MQLHDYQLVARDFLRGRSHAALMLDMGLGKTAASLSALTPDHLPVLVVAPKRVAEEVWTAERDLWRPDLTLVVAKGSPAARAALLAADADIVVLSRDNFRDVLTLKRKLPFRTLIIDELSGFKSRQSVRWKTAMTFAWKLRTIEHVWGLTGTPAPNGYLDVWPQIAILDKGERLGKNITTYRSRYFNPGRQLPNGTIIEWLLKPGAEDKIKGLISDICLAMATDGRIKLPETTFNYIPVELPPAVGTAYKKLEDDLVVDLRSIFADGHLHTAGNAAILTSRLSQMAAGFLYVDEAELHNYAYTPLHVEKVNAVKEIAESDHVGGVLVFYRYRAEAEMLRRDLASYGAQMIDEPGVIKAWNRGEVPIMLAHPASAGHGLNLQHGGHTIVWTSMTWDLELWEQANKRLARQGQKHPVIIHCLMAMRRNKKRELVPTVDQLIRDRLESKADVQNDLLHFLESPV